ncbi:MAG: LPS export ABC transporter periplasmic protein LptC [Bacteroidetes bacterium]|nr:LPS export ABC transporter periplasmic protein LptC [Bacteroidota bacterium]
MRELQLEHDNSFLAKYFKNIIIPAIAGIIMFFSSCERNNIEKINQITAEIDAPDIAVTNTEIVFSKNGRIEVKLISNQINRYFDEEEPYTEFPEGLYVEFYDSTNNVTSFIKANYCIYDEKEELWTAENDVVSVSDEGDTLNTDFLIWDQKKEKIYSDQYVRITNEDGIIHGKGFEANQDLSDWVIKNSSGTINVENEK